MAWTDRLKEAAYTSPSGVRIVFDYENVAKELEKRTTAFDFPDADGTFVQDLGNSGRRYPLRVFFWGENYDQNTDAFEAALSERGPGRLDHPLYGTIDVVPFGIIGRRDDLKTAANQAIVEVTFFETIGLIYPASQGDPASAVLAAVEEYNDAAAGGFSSEITSISAVEEAKFKNDYLNLLRSAKSGLSSIAAEKDEVERRFNAINDAIEQSIDVLVGEPLTLGFQTLALIQAPARAVVTAVARLEAYKNLALAIVADNDPSDVNDSNEFHTKDLYASTYVTGSVVSVVNTQFTTKSEALTAAEEILNQLDTVTTWRDENYLLLAEIDTGEAYQKLQEAVALTAGFLVEISFTLKQERRIVLTRNRTIIDLVAQYYGSIDDQLDFFINSNSLTGSEILEVPKGREIVYYI